MAEEFNVELLKKEHITPEFILARAWNQRDEIRDIFVIAVDKSGIVTMETTNSAKLPQIAELLTKAASRQTLGQKEPL